MDRLGVVSSWLRGWVFAVPPPPMCAYEWCYPWCQGCSETTSCSDPRIGSIELCGNGFDDDANGCADEGCTIGEPPCSCTTYCTEAKCGPTPTTGSTGS